MSGLPVILADGVPPSPASTGGPRREPWRVAAVQLRWDPDPATHRGAVAAGVAAAAAAGARLVCLPELTLSPYPASLDDPADLADLAAAGHLDPSLATPEPLDGGPTAALVTGLAREHGVFVSASLWEADDSVPPPRGYNTAVCASPAGELVARTRKLHLPVTAGYREDRWFAHGDGGHPVVDLGAVTAGFPTCWDQWFPELARAYSLGGAELLVYPTAIGSEPDHPAFDTEPLWEHVIRANGITNGTFMVAVNRTGTEQLGDGPAITFYGSSFISDPYGRVLAQAPRDAPAVVVADLDLDARSDWLALFPMLATRRPDTYHALVHGEDAP